MDEAVAITHLKRIFPNYSESLLRQAFRNCNYDLQRTVEALHTNMSSSSSSSSQRSSSIGQLCTSVFGTLCRFCCCCEEEVKDEHEFVPATGRSSERPPIVHEPTSGWVREGLLPIVHEPAPRWSREEPRRSREETRRSTEETRRSLRRSSQEVTFPVHSRGSTISLTQQLKIVQELEAKKDSKEAIKEAKARAIKKDETDAHVEYSGHHFRQLANVHARKRDEWHHKARLCLRNGNGQLANFHFRQAKLETERIERANAKAADLFLKQNNGSDDNKIDLHGLFVKEAVVALDNFLDQHILFLSDMNINSKRLMVVTGRGIHSKDGIPKLKPAVQRRLRERDLRHYQSNPGCLIVIVDLNSFTTDEL